MPGTLSARIYSFLCLAILCLIPAALTASSGTIRVDADPLRWTLSTAHSSLQVFLAADSNLAASWFGPLSGSRLFETPESHRPREAGTTIREIPYRGGYQELEPALEVVFEDNVRELELVYSGYETGETGGFPFIRFDLRDTHYPVKVSEYIRVLPELDIYEKWLVLENTGKKKILIENAQSGSLVLPPGQYELIQISGEWGREFYPRTSLLTPGVKSISIKALKSQPHAPFFMLRPAGGKNEFNGDVWFGEVAWTGNWRIDCAVNPGELTQITGGINWWNTHWNLTPGAKFETPKLVFGFSPDGASGASRRLHRYLLDHVLPGNAAREPSKVLYNSWYATEFRVNAEQQIALAKTAAEAGVELFVMDDGWFRGRKDDKAGLGDWTPDPEKFPRGLGPLIRAVNELGMDFGLWVEPEMVNPNSDLYRAHPDWALHTPNRTSHTGRNQLVLNLAREDVKQYTLDWLDKLLTENNIRFIKWDMNRYVSEAGWPEAPAAMQRELFIRYTFNMLDIFRTLRARHPQVVFESCCSGGGRVNPQILSVAEQIWASDNTDPGDRLHIQYGFSYAFPARSMVNWVTDEEWHGKKTSLRFKFHSAMAGNFGLGSDLSKWGESEKALAKELISQYKELRRTIQFGDQYRLWDPFQADRMAVQFVSRDRSESVVFAFQTLEATKMATSASRGHERLVLHGLDPSARYRVDYGDNRSEELDGRVLMASGIVPGLAGSYDSRVIVIRKAP